MTAGAFHWRPKAALEIRNVSDQPVTDVRLTVFAGAGPHSGVGDGSRTAGPLAPGETAVVRLGGGSGSGGAPGDELAIDLVVESVRVGACEYRPSQSVPIAGS